MLNLLTVTNIFCRFSVILFIAKMVYQIGIELCDKRCNDLEKCLLERGYGEKNGI